MINAVSGAQGISFSSELGKTQSSKSNGTDFSEILTSAMDNISSLEKTSTDSTNEIMVGETGSIHEIMIDSSKAEVALNLALQVRNKLLDGYNEVMRMSM